MVRLLQRRLRELRVKWYNRPIILVGMGLGVKVCMGLGVNVCSMVAWDCGCQSQIRRTQVPQTLAYGE